MVKYYCKDNNFEKMKLTALVILLSFSLKISGQQIIHPSNHYRNGDVQEKKQVIVEGIDLSGKNGVWSLEDENHGGGSVGSSDLFEDQKNRPHDPRKELYIDQ
jgi:hypothetical protein